MARQARKLSPTGFYHVMMRGNNKEPILSEEWQKAYFTELLSNAEKIEVAAYCLMGNHAHLVVKGQLTDLSEAVKKVNIKYAMRFNRATGRIGHVFQDRYRSEVIFDDAHLLQVIRYVHNNPVNAKMVKDPGVYPWSSYREYIYETSTVVSPAQMRLVMGFFADKLESFRQFHNGDDHKEFLDMPEDVEQNRLKAAQAVIDHFCNTRGLVSSRDMHRKPEYLEELIGELLQETRLSHRNIAQILNISNNAVHTTSLDMKAKT